MTFTSNLCSSSGVAVGVCQLVNKMEENTGKVKPFNRNDEQFLEAFVIFCGLGIQNTQMYEAVERAMAKQMVTLEVSAAEGTSQCPQQTLRSPCHPHNTRVSSVTHPHGIREATGPSPSVLIQTAKETQTQNICPSSQDQTTTQVPGLSGLPSAFSAGSEP